MQPPHVVAQTRSIVMPGPEVRSIRAGRKTQFRRPMDPQPECRPGDRLLVREEWAWVSDCAHTADGGRGRVSVLRPTSKRTAEAMRRVLYRATDRVPENAGLTWRPAESLPDADVRLHLEVVKVGVQCVQDITEDDAQAEGIRIEYLPPDPDNFHPPGSYGYVPDLDPEEIIQHTRREAYAVLWDHMHGKDHKTSWAADPRVWVVTFKRIEPPKKPRRQGRLFAADVE